MIKNQMSKKQRDNHKKQRKENKGYAPIGVLFKNYNDGNYKGGVIKVRVRKMTRKEKRINRKQSD